MALSDAQVQSLIVLEVGDTTTNLLSTNIGMLWTLYEDQANVGTRLRYLYVKRAAIDLLLGYYREYIDSETDGNSYKLSQTVTHLLKMRQAVEEALAQQVGQVEAARPPATGTLTATAPVVASDRDTPTTRVDGNDPRYRGDPYWRPSRSGP